MRREDERVHYKKIHLSKVKYLKSWLYGSFFYFIFQSIIISSIISLFIAIVFLLRFCSVQESATLMSLCCSTQTDLITGGDTYHKG